MAESRTSRLLSPLALLPVTRSALSVVAVVSLLATALLSLAVSRGSSGFALDRNAFLVLGRPPDVALWQHVADLLAAPVLAVVVLASLVFGALRGTLLRVGILTGFAVAAFLISEFLVKPAVGERFFGELSFPSGNVTAVCATALAMWLALYPVLRKWARITAFLLGFAWTLSMTAAVVGATWHTPLDCIGSVLLSLGVVTAGAALFQPKPAQSGGAELAEPLQAMGRA